MITRDQLACMWSAAYFRLQEAEDDLEKAYWLGKKEVSTGPMR